MPVGDLGLAIHEIFEVLLLLVGELPYDRYVPTTEELNQLKSSDAHVKENILGDNVSVPNLHCSLRNERSRG